MLFYTVKGESFVYTVYLKKLDILRLSSINHIFAKSILIKNSGVRFSTSFACILQHEGHNCFSFFHRIRLYSLQCISSLTNEKKWDKLLDSTSQLYVCFLHYTVYTTRLPVFWKIYNLWTPDNILLRILNKINFPIFHKIIFD